MAQWCFCGTMVLLGYSRIKWISGNRKLVSREIILAQVNNFATITLICLDTFFISIASKELLLFNPPFEIGISKIQSFNLTYF